MFNIFSIQNGKICQLDDLLAMGIDPLAPPHVKPRLIWIKFKFSDSSYNPAEHQLGVGKAFIGEDKYSNRDKAFSADWQKDWYSEGNVWVWGVTEGTNLDYAFTWHCPT